MLPLIGDFNAGIGRKMTSGPRHWKSMGSENAIPTACLYIIYLMLNLMIMFKQKDALETDVGQTV